MSDSDNELLTANTVYPFQNESTTISARGPNINTNNLTGLSFRNNVLTSTMNMPRNYEWQRRAESNYDQQSVGYRRETSPMSIASACDARHRKFNSSYYARGMSSQRSVYNGRGGSPMSMRSIDSNATMSATDIAMAFKTTQFNKYDMRIIKEAYNKFMKQKARKRIEKRRNLKLFLKGYRRKSGYDSGELGSNSSISSDENRSTRTSNYKTNMSSCRSTKTDIADFRRTIKDSNMFQDCTDNFRQNRMHGMLSKPANLNTSRSSVSSFRSMIEKSSTKSMPPPVNFNKTQSRSAMTQQDRFKNGFLLPSQRFNRSVAVSSIPEISEKPHHSQKYKYQSLINSNRQLASPSKHPQELNSDDDEEIFPETTTIERSAINQRKRSLDSGDDYICLPVQKKPKVASPCKNMSHSFKNSTVIEKAKNDFQFAKPAFPIKKSANIKSKEKISPNSAVMSTTEKLISKSRAPFPDINIPPPPLKQINSIAQPKKGEEKGQTEKEDSVEQSSESQNTTDLSMRPSFIKRKLFTQNMDVTEKHSDILTSNSPQNSIYGAIQKEKNKARKLVTSQYCLSRDIQTEDNNLLDLIHKIVPSEKMNATNQTTKTAVQNNMSEDNDDKWDVTSIISTRNYDENVSDTFTDEDTILGDGGKQSSEKVTGNMTTKSPPKKIIDKKVEKPPSKVTQVTQKVLVEKNGTPKKKVQKYVKTFWDTDFESDVEGTPALRKEELKENKRTENIMQKVESNVKFQGFSSMFPANKTPRVNNTIIMNNTVDSIQKFNITNKSFRLCSHRNTKPTKTVQAKIKEDPKPSIEQQSIKSKTATASCLDLSTQENKQIQSKHEDPKQETSKGESKKSPPKKRKTKKDNLIENKRKEPIKKQTSAQEQTLKSDEIVKSQNTKHVSVFKNPPKIKETQNKPQKLSITQNKNETKASENKTERNTRTTKCDTNKPQRNRTSVTSTKTRNNKKVKDQKANSTKLDTTVSKMKNNKNPKSAKNKNVSEPSDSEDSFAEPNNNRSIRPVRACRNSKQNKTHDTTNNHTLSRSLRSRDVSLSNNNITEETKPKAKAKVSKKTKTPKNEQSILSDLSFSIARDKHANKKPLSSLYNTRLFKSKDIDISDVSFSLNNDKDSPLPRTNQRNSAKSGIDTKFMKQAVIAISPIGKKYIYSLIEQRSIRNKLPNRRYVC